MVDNMIEYLKELGLSDYEARAYRALWQEHPLTGYEIAQRAGMPSSKVYQVLGKLEEKGLAICIAEEKKKRYIPHDLDEFIDTYRFRTEQTLDELKKEGRRLRQQSDVSYIWNLRNYREAMERAQRMIAACTGQILISCWHEELVQLYPALAEREKAGASIGLVHFGTLAEELRVGCCFSHPIADTLFAEKGGRGFTLVVDGREAMMVTLFDSSAATAGGSSERGEAEGAWSRNRGYVTLAEDYIKHDIYIMKIVDRFDVELLARFGDGYKHLRDVFSNTETGGEQP